MVRSIGLLLGLVLLAGCTSDDVAEPEPTPSTQTSTSVPSPTGSTQGCVLSGVTVAKGTDPEQSFVYAARLEKEEGSSTITQLAAAPYAPTFVWQTSPAPSEEEVLAAIAELDDAPIVEPRDGTDTVSAMLHDAGIAEGVVVGYSSIVTVQHVVRVSCEGGGQVDGTLTARTEPETGLVGCDEAPPKTQTPTPARLAYLQFCSAP